MVWAGLVGGWLSCREQDRSSLDWDESSFWIQHWIQVYLLNKVTSFSSSRISRPPPTHTQCWRLLVNEKSLCANLELKRISDSFIFWCQPIGLFFLFFNAILDCYESEPGAVCPLERSCKAQRFKAEWWVRQMRTLERHNNSRLLRLKDGSCRLTATSAEDGFLCWRQCLHCFYTAVC